jgi:hypothetical protein
MHLYIESHIDLGEHFDIYAFMYEIFYRFKHMILDVHMCIYRMKYLVNFNNLSIS